MKFYRAKCFLCYIFIIVELFAFLSPLNISFKIYYYLRATIALLSIFLFAVNSLLNHKKFYSFQSIWSICFLISLFFSTYNNYLNIQNPNYNDSNIFFHVSTLLLLFIPDYDINKNKFYKNIYTLIVISTFAITFITFFANIINYFYSVFNINIVIKLHSFDQSRRYFGSYTHPNIAAITGLLSIMLSLICLKFKYKFANKYIKNVFIFNVIIQSIMIVLTQSRSVLIIVIVSFVYYIDLVNIIKNKIKINPILFYSFIILILVLLFLFVSVKRDIVTNISGIQPFSIEWIEKILDSLSSSRLSLIKETITLGKNNIIFGNGVGTLYRTAVKTFGLSGVIVRSGHESAHNIIIDSFYNNGLIGLVLISCLFIYIFKLLFQITKNYENKLKSIIILQLIIFSLVDKSILYIQNFNIIIFWIILNNLQEQKGLKLNK